jgi:hypothetical protein
MMLIDFKPFKRRCHGDYMPTGIDEKELEGSEGKSIVRIRSVLWREVERGGNPKGLGRASINIPLEAIEILELEDRGDIVAFVMKKKTKDVILTNYFGSQPAAITKADDDPEILLDRLLARVLVLKSRKSEVSEKWEGHEIDDGEYLLKTKKINKQLEEIKENVGKILATSFRGSTDTLSFMQSKLKSFYDEYASTFISYIEDIVSKIHSLHRSIDALDSAYSKRLFNDDEEYHYEKEELESQLNSFKSLAHGAVQILNQYK